MAFLNETSSSTIMEDRKSMTIEEINKEKQQSKIAAIVKARGFDPSGQYAFYPHKGINIKRDDGSIIQGMVKGSYELEKPGKIVMNMANLRQDAKHWRFLLSLIDPVFEFTDPNEVEEIELDLSSVKVSIALKTPTGSDDIATVK